MKVKVLAAKGYHYTKDGNEKQGMTIDVCSIDQLNESDGKGNFTVGHPSENIFIPRTCRLEPNDIVNLVGKDVELKYERKLGQRFETLVDIEVLK